MRNNNYFDYLIETYKKEKRQKKWSKLDMFMLVFGVCWLVFIIGWLASGRIIIG